MGTSTSSKGGGSRSPFDPEWLSPPEGGNGGDSPAPGDGEGLLQLMPTTPMLTGRATRLAVKTVM